MRARRLLFAAGASLLLGLAAPSFGQETLDPEAFVDRLTEARRQAEASEAAPSPEAMNSVRHILGLPVVIAVGDTGLLIERDPFLDSLRGDRRVHFRRAAAHLALLQTRLGEALQSPPLDKSRLSRALAAAYTGIETPRPSLIERIEALIAGFMVGVIDRIYSLLLGGPTGRIASVAALAAIVLGLLLFVWRLMVRLGLVPEKSLPEAPHEFGDAVDWRALAERALAGGNRAAAVRALYQVLIKALVAEGIIRDAPGLTSGECRSLVNEKRPALYPAVAKATAIFDRVAYGLHDPDAGEVSSVVEAEKLVRSA